MRVLANVRRLVDVGRRESSSRMLGLMTEEARPPDSPRLARDNPLTRSVAGMLGFATLGLIFLACVLTLPWTLGWTGASGEIAPYKQQNLTAQFLPPVFVAPDERSNERRLAAGREIALARLAAAGDEAVDTEALLTAEMIDAAAPTYLLGSDQLGRSVLVRCLAGGGVSIGMGLAAALISVIIGTVYGTISAYVGGRVDAVMMRIVDVLYGLPYILLVVLLAVAVDALALGAVARTGRELTEGQRITINVVTLLVAIGGVSWLTMARVIRGQVLSLKEQPFMEAARAIGASLPRQFTKHLLPNLMGPIIVYATLTAPQAILQESFLSFLGIGVQPPLPSWGNLVADGLSELNTVKSRWWLLLFPSVLLGVTLLSLNFVGEGLREAFDPKRAKRG